MKSLDTASADATRPPARPGSHRRRLRRTRLPLGASVWACAESAQSSTTWLDTVVVKTAARYSQPGDRVLLVAPPAGAGTSSSSLANSTRRPWRRYDGLADSAWNVTRLGRSVQTATGDVSDASFHSPPTGGEPSAAGSPRSRFQLIISAINPETADRFDVACWARALTPDGRLALITHCQRQRGRWVDIGTTLRADGRRTGLQLVDHVAVLQVPLHTVATHPSPIGGGRHALAIVHADLYVFASLLSTARSGR